MIKLKRLFLTAAVSLATVIAVFSGCLTAGAAEVNGTSALSMKYYTGTASSKQWKTFKTSATDSGITGLRLTTDPNASYYLEYQTQNSGLTYFFGEVSSLATAADAYAGTGDCESEAKQRAIQCIRIRVLEKGTDAEIKSEIVVMYRTKTGGRWLPWVSNADPEWMESVKSKYGLDGTLDKSGSYAGLPGQNIEGLEIRLFDERGGQGEPDEGITEISGKEESPALSFTANGSQSFVSFNRVTLMQSGTINTLKIQTDPSKQYYLSYRVRAEGESGYYSAVKSTDTGADAYAGVFSKPIQTLEIEVCTKSGTSITENIVVMFRAYTDRWLPWVSNADPEWMKSVKLRYNIAGSLDTGSGYAGIVGQNIKAVEIRLFEEKDIITDVSHSNEVSVAAPYISQVGVYPTGCESVSTVMALQAAGIDITVDRFIDNYLDMTSDTDNFDPNVSFGGNPRGSGFGCYAPVIKKALDKALAGSDFYGENITGKTLSQLCSEYIDNGIPVITWATTDMKESYPGKQLATMTWIAPEHCLLLVGYDDSCYIFNDPQRQANKHYLKADVEAAYKALGSQAVVVLEKEPVCPDAPSTAEPQEYARENSAEQSIYNNAVDLSRGSHIIRTELISPAADGKTAFTISYDSSRLVSGSLGAGWYHNFEMRLEAYGDIVWIYETPSVRCGYTRTASNTYAAYSHGRENYILTRLDDGWLLDRNKTGKLYFDLSGRLTAAEDKNLNKTVISYSDNKIEITDSAAGKITLTLTDGLVTGVTDGASVFNLTYKNGYLLSVGNTGGETVYYTYNEQGRIETGTGGKSGYFRNVYDGAGRLSEQVTDEESGIKTAFAYTETADGLTVGITAAGGKKSIAYFSGGMLVKFQAEDGGVTEYAYDGNLNLTSVLYPDGKSEVTVYNALNLPVRHTDISGITKAMAYDGNNNLISAVYDDKGDLNGDGEVDVRDLVRMKRLLADGETPVNSGSADINSDLSENASDSAVLQRYLFGFRDGNILCETFVYNDKNQLISHTGTDGTVTEYNPESAETSE